MEGGVVTGSEGWTPEAIERLKRALKEADNCPECGQRIKPGETIEGHLKIEHPEGE